MVAEDRGYPLQLIRGARDLLAQKRFNKPIRHPEADAAACIDTHGTRGVLVHFIMYTVCAINGESVRRWRGTFDFGGKSIEC